MYLSLLSLPNESEMPQAQNMQGIHIPAETATLPNNEDNTNPENQARETSATAEQLNEIPVLEEPNDTFNLNPIVTTSHTTISPVPFDAWIDNLVEFKETILNESPQSLSVADALYKLEASRDIPTIQLLKFNGSPLSYADFVDQFKIHIHDKSHLTDDMRMMQLKMHLTGDAECAISGLGSKGVMYATALKTLKEQFGQPSTIARALVSQLVK